MQNDKEINHTQRNEFPNFSSIKPAQVFSTTQQILEENKKKINSLLENKTSFTWDSLIYPLEAIENHLHLYWSMVNHLHHVMNNELLREAYENFETIRGSFLRSGSLEEFQNLMNELK